MPSDYFSQMSSDYFKCKHKNNVSFNGQYQHEKWSWDFTLRNGHRDWWALRVGVWEEEGGLTAGTSVTPPTTLPLQGLQAISPIHAAEV